MELLNYAFKNKRFPDVMKHAEITPLFKKKKYINKQKDRPISIAAVYSHVSESIIAKQLM